MTKGGRSWPGSGACRRWCRLLIALTVFGAGPARAEGLTPIAGFVRDRVPVPFTLPDGTVAMLEAMVVRPLLPGRLPAVLITHGTPRDAADDVKTSAVAYSGPAVEFARHGWAVLVLVRRGYGRSEGGLADTVGPCGAPDYRRAGLASAEDVLAGVDFLRHQPWADPDRLLLVGQSTGGFAVTAALSLTPPGVVGAISFAGGRGSSAADTVCQPERLVAAEAVFGRTARQPALWIYAENDHYFGPALARDLATAYHDAGAPVTFVSAPPYGTDGHGLFLGSTANWWPMVAGFLDRLHLPATIVAELPPLPPPPGLGAAGLAAFRLYLAEPRFEKAFASAGGAYGWVSGRTDAAEAAQAAVAACGKHESRCAVYAIGNNSAR